MDVSEGAIKACSQEDVKTRNPGITIFLIACLNKQTGECLLHVKKKKEKKKTLWESTKEKKLELEGNKEQEIYGC